MLPSYSYPNFKGNEMSLCLGLALDKAMGLRVEGVGFRVGQSRLHSSPLCKIGEGYSTTKGNPILCSYT